MHKSSFQSRMLMAVMGGILLASCSNIPEDERYIYVKPAEVKRSVLIEDFTGQRCINCPNANDEIATLQQQYGKEAVIAVGIHSGPLGFKGNAKFAGLATDLGDAYYYHWGADHQPIGMVNRGGLTDYTAWSGQVRKALEQSAPIALQLSNAYQATDHSIHISLHLEGRDGQVDGKLQLWVVEDSIQAMQKMPDGSTDAAYMHQHVLRDAVNGEWGEPISIGEGESKDLSWQYSPKAEWNAAHLAIVAFVYNDSGVLQVTKSAIQLNEK